MDWEAVENKTNPTSTYGTDRLTYRGIIFPMIHGHNSSPKILEVFESASHRGIHRSHAFLTGIGAAADFEKTPNRCLYGVNA
jgi:hypothetical protein